MNIDNLDYFLDMLELNVVDFDKIGLNKRVVLNIIQEKNKYYLDMYLKYLYDPLYKQDISNYETKLIKSKEDYYKILAQQEKYIRLINKK